MLASLVLLVLPAALDAESAALFTGIVAAAAAEDARVDVVTAEDLRRALDVEAGKAAMGCSEEQSCLAEIASAMGARVVLYGTTGQLEDQTVITLQLFDSKTGSSGGRSVSRATTKRELSTALENDARRLVQSFLTRATLAEGERVRMIVMDLKGEARPTPLPPTTPAEPAPGNGVPLLAVAGGGVAGLGVLLLAAGVGVDALLVAPLDARARDVKTPQIEAEQAYVDRDATGFGALICYGVGAVFLVGGGIIAGVGLLVGGE